MNRLPNNSPRKFWNLAFSPDGASATLSIEGEICDTPNDWIAESEKGHYYTSDDFRADIDSLGSVRSLTVNINSPGGNLYTGLAIHAALKSIPAKVTTVVQGIAMSAASVIFCAGDKRLVHPSSLLMLHGVSVGEDILGLYNEAGLTDLLSKLRNDREAVRKMNEAIAAVYSSVTHQSTADSLALISGDSESWLTSQDAVSSGLATGFASDDAEPLTLVACGSKTALYSGTHLLSHDFKAPRNASELGFLFHNPKNMENNKTPEPEAPATQDAAPVTPTAVAEKPAVDANAVNDAIRSERERIAGIRALAEKLGSRVSKELVDAACFGDSPMSPQDFALEAINALPADTPAPVASANPDYLAARAEELAPASAVATATPPAAPAPNQNRGLNALNRILAREKSNPNH